MEMDRTSRKWVVPRGKWTVQGNVSYYLRETGKSIVSDGKELGQQSESQAPYPLSTRDYPRDFSLCCAVRRFVDSFAGFD